MFEFSDVHLKLFFSLRRVGQGAAGLGGFSAVVKTLVLV